MRWLILRTQDDKLIMEIPLTAGAVFGSVVTLFAPLLAGLGALAALRSPTSRCRSCVPTIKPSSVQVVHRKAGLGLLVTIQA